jgi:hypothetical protein
VSFDDDMFEAQLDEMNPGYRVGPSPELVAAGPGGLRGPLAVRGGIKYPTPTPEENTMTERTPEMEEIDHLLDLRKRLDDRVRELRTKIHNITYPPAPAKSIGDRFKVLVQFEQGGTKYEFLLLRTDKGWYTTGKTEDGGYFGTWKDLIDFLRGPDIYWHSPIQRLQVSDVTVLGAEWPNS